MIPKVKLRVRAESYKQLTFAEGERSSSSLSSLPLHLLSAVQSRADSAASKTFY